jgi:hypothetical protein
MTSEERLATTPALEIQDTLAAGPADANSKAEMNSVSGATTGCSFSDSSSESRSTGADDIIIEDSSNASGSESQSSSAVVAEAVPEVKLVHCVEKASLKISQPGMPTEKESTNLGAFFFQAQVIKEGTFLKAGKEVRRCFGDSLQTGGTS